MEDTSSPSFLRRVVAVVVLAIAVIVLLKIAVGFLSWLATVAIFIGAVIAVIWAVRTVRS